MTDTSSRLVTEASLLLAELLADSSDNTGSGRAAAIAAVITAAVVIRVGVSGNIKGIRKGFRFDIMDNSPGLLRPWLPIGNLHTWEVVGILSSGRLARRAW